MHVLYFLYNEEKKTCMEFPHLTYNNHVIIYLWLYGNKQSLFKNPVLSFFIYCITYNDNILY